MPTTPSTPFIGNMGGQRQKKQQRPQELDEDLVRSCREFLKNTVPISNILFVEEFAKYLPLFNKKMNESMDPKQLTQLGDEYFGRFSAQHSIYLLTHEPDANGMKHPAHQGKFKVDKVIPPTFRRVSSLNDVGKKLPYLINAFFNATANTSGPFDHRKETYAKQIADAIGLGDKKAGNVEKQRSEFRRMEDELVSNKPRSEASKQSSPEETNAVQPSENLQIEW